MTARLTVYFIVEPPDYEVMACYLAASLREQFGQTVALVGYCPAPKLPTVNPEVRVVLEKLGCDLRSFAVEGRFDPPYPHGNKLLATLEPRDTEFSCFMDSDVLCIRPNMVDNLIRADYVSIAKATSLNWAPQTIWDEIYRTCDMEKPAERFRLSRQKRGDKRVPYFNSGLFSFPEQHRNADGKTFAQVWMEIAQKIDANPDIPNKRPYLDQMSMPLAIKAAGLNWNILPEEQHYILGGTLRGDPLPAEMEIYTVHYRKWRVLREVQLHGKARRMLKAHAGIRKLAKIPQTVEVED